MQVSYSDKKMIITHPTGIISEYTKADLARFKIDIENDIVQLNSEKDVRELQIANANATAGN